MESVWNQRRLSLGCWLVAGVPVVASFVQATIALIGVSAFDIPVIGAITTLLQSVAVLDAAGVVFRNSPGAVLALFVLVLVGWIAEGVAVFLLEHRTAGYGTAGFVTLFFALFLLVYSPLFGADVPAAELAAFVLVPVVASVASWGTVLTYEWSVTLDDETAETLTTARTRTENARTAFDRTIEERADDHVRQRVKQVAPGAVRTVEEHVAEFRDETQELLDEIETLREETGHIDSRERNQRARQLLTSANELDPEAAADRAIAAFTDALIDAIRQEFGDVHLVSTYGAAYEVRNFREYNELRVGPLGQTAQLGGEKHDLDDVLADAIEDGQPLPDVARATELAGEHVEELRATVDQHEAAFVEETDATESRLDRVRELVESMDGEAGKRLSEFLIDGRLNQDNTNVPSTVSVTEQLRTARTDLHACRFEDARRDAEEARSSAGQLVAMAEFFARSVVATVEQRVGSVPIPPDVDETLADSMRVSLEETYPVTVTVENETMTLRYENEPMDVDESSTDAGPTKSRVLPGSGQTDADVDDVLYLLRELRDSVSRSATDNMIEFQTGSIPDQYVNESILLALESLASRRSDIDEVSVPDDAPPGYIRIVAEDSSSPRNVVESLYDEYLRAQKSE